MIAKRTTITISYDLYERALLVMRARLIDDFSGFVQILIREEFERRQGMVPLAEAVKLTVSEPGPTVKDALKAIVEHHADVVEGKRRRKPKP